MAKNIFENSTTSYVTNVNNAAPCKEKAHIYFYNLDCKEMTNEETGEIENVPYKINFYVKTSSRRYLWTRFMNSEESSAGTKGYIAAILADSTDEDDNVNKIFKEADSFEDICDKLLKREFIFEIGKDRRVTIKTERSVSHTKVIPDLV